MSQITFKVNGKECTVGSEVPCTLMLVDYLRHNLELRGTKFMCKEAGCGACIVSVVKTSGGTVQAVNSCVVPVLSCKDWEITTIEGLGNRKDGYHNLQKNMANSNASQCGYCSPGWIMALHSLLENDTEITMKDMENSFGSNICRCTGYRPIMDAFKKCASDYPSKLAAIEDLHICDKNASSCCKGSCIDYDWCMVKAEDSADTIKMTLVDGTRWYVVSSLAEIFNIFATEGTDSYILAAGSTAKVPYPLTENPEVVIDINCVTELKGYELDQNLVVGAGCTLTELIDIFKTVSETDGFSYLTKLNEHLDYVAHIPVRNIGTIAGNLCIKHSNNAFSSDVFLLLTMVDAEITVEDMYGRVETCSTEGFLEMSMVGKVMTKVTFPPLSATEYLIETYKIMSRCQAVHAIVNCAFLYKLTSDNVVCDCRLVYGSIDSAFIRATQTENYLVGKALFTNETVQGALAILAEEIVPVESPPEPSPEIRKNLALRLFYKSVLHLCPTSTVHPRYLSGASKIHSERPVSEGTQTYTTDSSLYPLNEPIMKLEALIQCAGEAQYTDDIPHLPNEVHASLVLSTVATGEIVSIDPTTALEQTGVIAFYSAKDIPGINTFTPDDLPLYTSLEETFCSGSVKYFHQPIGVIVAETQAIADSAALLVTVKYKNVKTAVIDIEIAKEDSTRCVLYTSADASETGTDITKVVNHTKALYGQYHFPMETIACITKPTQEGLLVHVTTQWPNAVQLMLSRALNISECRIDVVIGGVGGSYGFKLSRSCLAAVACGLITLLLNRPCRLLQTLSVNMKAFGKRCPSYADYNVSVDSTGFIQSADMSMYLDNGHLVNENFIALSMDALNNCYFDDKMSYKFYNITTDTAKNTWCRAPGTLELISNMELLMDRIAYALGLSPIDVRLANLDTTNHSAVKELYETLNEQADYASRRKEVDTFNANNRWRKRGLSYSFMRWTPITAGAVGVLVSVFHGDGSVAIQHGGIEMGQGINTKAAQVCAYLLGVSIDKVQVKSCNTNAAPNCFPTGGSIASQNICAGTYDCCKQILELLEPIKATLDSPTWEELVAAAFTANVKLQAVGLCSSTDFETYNAYGVTLSEVEVDILTGEIEVLRVDLIEDVGRSVSPEIDVGQAEGAFMMALGYWLSEELVYSDTGALITNRAWTYHPPQCKDIPQKMNITFRTNSYSNDSAFGAKCVGEPPACMAVSVPLAIREALVSARSENGIDSTEWFEIKGAYTVAKVGSLGGTTTENLVLY